jgi:hypothetical protein
VVHIDTTDTEPRENARMIYAALVSRGLEQLS